MSTKRALLSTLATTAAGTLAAHVAKTAGDRLAALPGRLVASYRARNEIAVDLADVYLQRALVGYLRSEDEALFSDTRSLSAYQDYVERTVDGEEVSRWEALLDLGPGTHGFSWGGRRWELARWKEDAGSPDSPFSVPIDRWRLTGYGASRSEVDALFAAAYEWKAAAEAGEGTTLRVHVLTEGGYWSEVAGRYPRPPESVVLERGLTEEVIGHALAFYDRRDWYRDMAIPHRCGYCFFGPPGTGKTSLAEAIASAVGAGLFLIQFTPKLDDAALGRALRALPPRSVVLAEDIDTVFHGREPVMEKQSLTFTGLLNAIDGVAAAEGRVLVMTTNEIGHVDEALRRPGRVDHLYHLGLADGDVALRLFDRFYPGADEFDRAAFERAYAALPERLKPAALQVHFQSYGPGEASATLGSLVGRADLGVRPKGPVLAVSDDPYEDDDFASMTAPSIVGTNPYPPPPPVGRVG